MEIVIDAGGEVRGYEIEATRNGRRVEIETGRGIVTVSEVTRSGTPVRTARFMASRILALVEHPAADQNIAREVPERLGPPVTGEKLAQLDGFLPAQDDPGAQVLRIDLPHELPAAAARWKHVQDS